MKECYGWNVWKNWIVACTLLKFKPNGFQAKTVSKQITYYMVELLLNENNYHFWLSLEDVQHDLFSTDALCLQWDKTNTV